MIRGNDWIVIPVGFLVILLPLVWFTLSMAQGDILAMVHSFIVLVTAPVLLIGWLDDDSESDKNEEK